MEQAVRTCPLCPGEGQFLTSFQGAYDHSMNRLTFRRDFYRCNKSSCGAVFYYDETVRTDENHNWKNDHVESIAQFERYREELVESEPYQTMMQAREVSDDTITKDRNLSKQVKEIDNRIVEAQTTLENFHDNMRNFEWADNEAIETWIEANWLPPKFADKALGSEFGMSRPMLRNDIPQDVRNEWQRDEDDLLFKEGQPIVHAVWGQGRVLNGNADGGTIITAEFPQKGKKTMDLRYAKVQSASSANG